MSRYPKGTSPKLTEELIEEIVLLLKRGAYIESAAAACGISKDSFYRWLKKGKRDVNCSLEKKLSDAVIKALAEAELRDLDIIDKAAHGTPDKLATDDEGNLILDSQGRPVITEYGLAPNWKASAWRLERKFPERWGRKTSVAMKETEESSRSIEVIFVDSLES
jgi:transposase